MTHRFTTFAAAVALASTTALASPTPAKARNGRWIAAGAGLLAAGAIASALAPRYYGGGPYAAYAYAPGYVGYGYAPSYYGYGCVTRGAYRPDYGNC